MGNAQPKRITIDDILSLEKVVRIDLDYHVEREITKRTFRDIIRTFSSFTDDSEDKIISLLLKKGKYRFEDYRTIIEGTLRKKYLDMRLIRYSEANL